MKSEILIALATAGLLASPRLGAQTEKGQDREPSEPPKAGPKPKLKVQGRIERREPQPLEDGTGNRHGDFEKQGWVYLFDGRVAAGASKGDPLGLWRLRDGGDPRGSSWSVVEEDGQRRNVRLNGEVIHSSLDIPLEKRKGTGGELTAAEGGSDDVEAAGPLVLQGDQGPVDFRNIRVRPRIAPVRVFRDADQKAVRDGLKELRPDPELKPGKAEKVDKVEKADKKVEKADRAGEAGKTETKR